MATISPASALDRYPFKAAEGENLGRTPFLDDIAVHVERLDRHVDGQFAALDAAGTVAEERVAVEQGSEHPERASVDPLLGGDMADDRVEQGQVARLDHQ